MSTDAHGTDDWYTAASARAPRRIVPARSASVPMTKPGWSAKLTTGRREAADTSPDAPRLFGRVGGQPAGVVVGVRGEDAPRAPRQAGQARDDRSPEARPELEDRAGVE